MSFYRRSKTPGKPRRRPMRSRRVAPITAIESIENPESIYTLKPFLFQDNFVIFEVKNMAGDIIRNDIRVIPQDGKDYAGELFLELIGLETGLKNQLVIEDEGVMKPILHIRSNRDLDNSILTNVINRFMTGNMLPPPPSIMPPPPPSNTGRGTKQKKSRKAKKTKKTKKRKPKKTRKAKKSKKKSN